MVSIGQSEGSMEKRHNRVGDLTIPGVDLDIPSSLIVFEVFEVCNHLLMVVMSLNSQPRTSDGHSGLDCVIHSGRNLRCWVRRDTGGGGNQ